MNTVTTSAAVSAIVTVLVGTAMNWGERIVSWVRRRYPADHQPISGANPVANASSATDKVRVVVSCAPNRSLRPGDVQPQQAIDFVRAQFPGRFPEEPAQSMPPYWVRFEAADGPEHGYANVQPSGRIDLCVEIPSTSEPVTFALVDIVEPLALMHDAISSVAYDRAFRGRWKRFRRRRFDWAIGVSQYVFISSSVSSFPWRDVTFIRQRPPRAGTKQQPACPMLGYAAAELRDWNPRRSTKDLLRVFLRDFLQQNGFHDVEGAIAETVSAIGAWHVPGNATSP